MNNNLIRIVGATSIAVACISGDAMAVTKTASLPVTATVAGSCTFGAVNPLDFGAVDPTGLPADAQTTFNITCTNGHEYEVGMDAGAGSGATVTVRKMTFAGDTLEYGIYTDSGRANIWTDIGGTNTYAGTGTGAAQVIQVYGRVFSNANNEQVPAGAYSDTVTITVSY